jgi:hypothetical protein
LRMAPQGSASTCTVRVTPLPFMKQTARHINMNTEWLCRLKLCRFWLAGNLLGHAIQLGVQFVQVESFSGHAVGLIRQNEPGQSPGTPGSTGFLGIPLQAADWE